MKNKKNWLGMLVMVLVFGMSVGGCVGMPVPVTSGPDPRSTDGKGGRIQINFTGTEVYYLVIARDNRTNQTNYTLNPRLGQANNVQINEHDDCTVTLYYRRKRQNDVDANAFREDKSSWLRKSFYLTNDERIDVTIP